MASASLTELLSSLSLSLLTEWFLRRCSADRTGDDSLDVSVPTSTARGTVCGCCGAGDKNPGGRVGVVVRDTDLGSATPVTSEVTANIGSLLMLRALGTLTGEEADELLTVPFLYCATCCNTHKIVHFKILRTNKWRARNFNWEVKQRLTKMIKISRFDLEIKRIFEPKIHVFFLAYKL